MAAPTKVPDKKPYRVVTAGASYLDPTEGLDALGEPTLLQVYRVGHFGEEILLTDPQAARLTELRVVVPAGDAPSYKEQTVEELQDLVDARGLEVSGSGANGGVLKDDLIVALNAFDKGSN